MKMCWECNTEKPECEFPSLWLADECGPRHSYCRPCVAARTKIWSDNNRDKIAARHKINKKPNQDRYRAKKRDFADKCKDILCMDCGNKFPPLCMDFDHVRGEKTANISEMVYASKYSMDTLRTEIEKCEVVCANCHRLRTSQNGWGLNHRDKEQQSLLGVN